MAKPAAGFAERSTPTVTYDADLWRQVQAQQLRELRPRLPLATFPEKPAYLIEQVLDEDFMPGRPWSPDDLSE